MMRRTTISLGWLALVACWLQGSAARVLAQEMNRVSIALLPDAVVDDSLVSLDHIAKLSGGPDYLRTRLSKLDVAEFKLGSAHRTVTSEQVRFRLLLAGLEEAQFFLVGAPATVILESGEPATLRKILAAAEQSLRAHYPGDAAGITLTPNRSINVPLVELNPGERVRFEAKVKTPLPQAGRALVDVALVVGGRTREVVTVAIDIAESDPVVQTQAKGNAAIRSALYTAPALDARPLIKSGDNVKIVAHVGTARIEALGEALQDGRVGELIRVRNVESNRTVHGKIEASGRVIVDY